MVKADKFYYLVGDKFQSFPILYYVDSEQVTVSDSLGLIEQEANLVVNKNSLHEFIAMGVVTGCETLYNNLFVVEAGQIVRINRQSGEIYKIDYYIHRYFNDYTNKSFDELKDELDSRLKSVFNYVKKQLGERTVVVTLSGGYDSRLVVENLKKTNY